MQGVVVHRDHRAKEKVTLVGILPICVCNRPQYAKKQSTDSTFALIMSSLRLLRLFRFLGFFAFFCKLVVGIVVVQTKPGSLLRGICNLIKRSIPASAGACSGVTKLMASQIHRHDQCDQYGEHNLQRHPVNRS